MTPTGSDWNPNTTTYREAENYYLDENGEIMPTRINSAKAFKDNLLQSQAGMARDGLYEKEILHIPEGYEVEKSALNKLYTVAPAHLVPETDDWKLVVPEVVPSSLTSPREHSATVSNEPEWEILTSPSRTSFTNNIIAREAMGQMTMAIGSTSIWNNHCLFPDGNDNIADKILDESINRWSERTICSNVASIRARLPYKEMDDNSYDMLDDESIRIKKESDDDNYSIYSDDERKPPAKSHLVPTTIESIRIKQESEDDTSSICSDDEMDEMKPPAKSHLVSTTIGFKQEMAESENEMILDNRKEMEHICKQEEFSSDKSMDTVTSTQSVGRVIQVKEER